MWKKNKIKPGYLNFAIFDAQNIILFQYISTRPTGPNLFKSSPVQYIEKSTWWRLRKEKYFGRTSPPSPGRWKTFDILKCSEEIALTQGGPRSCNHADFLSISRIDAINENLGFSRKIAEIWRQSMPFMKSRRFLNDLTKSRTFFNVLTHHFEIVVQGFQRYRGQILRILSILVDS